MIVTGLDHVGLEVRNLDQALRFYRDLLGIPVREYAESGGPQIARIMAEPDAETRIADLDLGAGRVLELVQRTDSAAPTPNAGSAHVALLVGDVRTAWQRVTQAGFAARSAPVTLIDAGPYWTGATVVYVTDPDGYTVELVEAAQASA